MGIQGPSDKNFSNIEPQNGSVSGNSSQTNTPSAKMQGSIWDEVLGSRARIMDSNRDGTVSTEEVQNFVYNNCTNEQIRESSTFKAVINILAKFVNIKDTQDTMSTAVRIHNKLKTFIKADTDKDSNISNSEIADIESSQTLTQTEKNDLKFAKELASLADIYVNDAFGVSHRKHASTYGVARLLPNAIGFLVETELNVISQALQNSRKPFVAIFGGFKVKDKIKVLTNILSKADVILIGGAMAYPFLVAKWRAVGMSPASPECVGVAQKILLEAERLQKRIILPIDHIAVKANDRRQRAFVTSVLEENMIGCDIGPKTVEVFGNEIKKAGQVIWNGPLGKYEEPKFREGTFKIIEILANSPCYSIVGGGDSVSAVNQSGKAKMISHLSTGGGATMHLLEGGSLPAIDVIQEGLEWKKRL